MGEEAKQNREDIIEIKKALALGYISYDEALEKVRPIIDRINKKGEQIAKKYNRGYNKITFQELMR